MNSLIQAAFVFSAVILTVLLFIGGIKSVLQLKKKEREQAKRHANSNVMKFEAQHHELV